MTVPNVTVLWVAAWFGAAWDVLRADGQRGVAAGMSWGGPTAAEHLMRT